jgi:hypothetical protein
MDTRTKKEWERKYYWERKKPKKKSSAPKGVIDVAPSLEAQIIDDTESATKTFELSTGGSPELKKMESIIIGETKCSKLAMWKSAFKTGLYCHMKDSAKNMPMLYRDFINRQMRKEII